jgi:prolipoprotein diacylglyceryltransferase
LRAFIPSPPTNGFHVGPLLIHAYGLAYVVAVIAAVVIMVRRWEAKGGTRDLVHEVALWGFPAGLIGGRLYFQATSCPTTSTSVCGSRRVDVEPRSPRLLVRRSRSSYRHSPTGA